MGKYDEVGVINVLKRMSGISIDTNVKVITIANSVPFGNGTNGKLDFLCNYCGYKKIYKANVAPRKGEKKYDADDSADVNIKHKPKDILAAKVNKIMARKR
jgi:hypothetical protein|nr:MAG TPA: hypothetical protein [Crassvirales sp.]